MDFFYEIEPWGTANIQPFISYKIALPYGLT